MKLNEVKRQQLLTKTKTSDNYKDMSKGRNRYERRLRSRIAKTVAQYNRIDMDAFFKRDFLNVGIEVYGETSNYIVSIRFDGVLKEIARQVRANKGKLDFRIILRSLITVFNNDDVYIHCTCPDFKYRQAYYATKNGYNSGPKEPRPSDITNPNDTKGAGCKHVALVLSNLDWMMKVASTINNYIKYCQQYMQRNYADYIFPKIYGTPYKKAVQMNLFDNGLLPSDQKTLDASNAIGADSGKFKPGNPYRFKKKDLPNPNQQSFFNDELDKNQEK